MALPIVTIYFLGFNLSVDAMAIKVNREYKNLVTNEIINKKDDFIEKLTHDCYVVQIPRIEGKLQSRLEKLLSLFEQRYFVDERGIIKEYNYPVDDEEIKAITDMLNFACTDPASRKEIESEIEAIRVYNLGIEQETEELNQQIQEKDKKLEEQSETINQLEKKYLDLFKELKRMKELLEKRG